MAIQETAAQAGRGTGAATAGATGAAAVVGAVTPGTPSFVRSAAKPAGARYQPPVVVPPNAC